MRNFTKKQKEIISLMSPEILIKEVLCGAYERIHNSNVFVIAEEWRAEEIKKSKNVKFAADLKSLTELVADNGNVNILVSNNLINKVLLEKVLDNTTLSKNIFWANI